jgi:hypothetical protein
MLDLTHLYLTFSQLFKRYPSGKEERANTVTVTIVSIIYSELRKPVDYLNCTLKVVIAKSTHVLKLKFFYSDINTIHHILAGIKTKF